MEENYSNDLFPFIYIYILNLKLKKVTTSLTGGIKKPFSEVALQTRESLKRPYFPLPLSILAGTNLIMLLLLLFFFATPVWFPRKSIPHLISGKIHPCLISEKIHAKPQEKPEKLLLFFFVFFVLLPVFSGSVLGVSLLLCHSI